MGSGTRWWLMVSAAVAASLGTSGVAVAAGTAGGLYAFGNNFGGELGVTTDAGTSNANPTPAPVKLPSATGPVRRVAINGGTSLVITSTGQLFAFGDNNFGELGNTTNNGTMTANPTPTLVTLPGATGPVVDAAAGEDFSLAVTSTGQLYAWGNNRFGQLGNATDTGANVAHPTPTLVTLPGATGPVTGVAAGPAHSLAMTSSGQLYAFGENNFGQLGTNTNSGTMMPNPVSAAVFLPAAIGPVVRIAAGFNTSFAVTSSGQLYGFGQNNFGQLGNTTNNGTGNPTPTPTLVTLLGATGVVTQVAAGSHTLALTSTGQLYAFGVNSVGQLGNSNIGLTNPTPTPVSLPAATGPVVQMDAGGAHSVAVTSTGQVFAFGSNSFGQLGNATNAGVFTPNPVPTLVALPAGDTIDTVGHGPGDHTMLVIADLAITTTSLPRASVNARYSAAVAAAGGAPPLTWSASGLPSGLSINAATGAITGIPTAVGTSTVSLTVVDGDGIVASGRLPLTVSRLVAPVLTGLAVAPRRLALTGHRVRGKCVAIARARRQSQRCKRRIAITLRYRLSKAALVTISVATIAPGRTVHGRCVAPTKNNRKRPRCTRTRPLPGKLTHKSGVGQTSFTWNGRIGGRTLTAGTYRVTATPAASGLVGRALAVTLTVVR